MKELSPVQSLLLQFGIILFVALTFGALFEGLGLPSVLGYTLAGYLMGPSGLGIVHSSDIVDVMADLGLVLLLFYIGLEFSIRRLLRSGPQALFLSPVKSGLGFLGGYLVARLVGLNHLAGLVAGAAVAVSSTGIISNNILERRLQHTPEAQLSLAMLILEDILSVLFIAFLLSGGGAELQQVFLNAFLVVLLILTVGIYVSRWFFRVIRRFGHEDRVALYALGLLILFSYGVAFFGISPALGAFFAGVSLAEIASAPRIERELDILKRLFVIIFFTAIGLSYAPALTTRALVLAALLYIVQVSVVFLAAFLSPLLGMPPKSAARFFALYVPVGEFSLFFAAAATKAGIEGAPEILGAVFLLIFLTTITSKLLLEREEKLFRLFLRILPHRWRIPRYTSTRPSSWYEKRVEKHIVSILSNLGALFALAYLTDYIIQRGILSYQVAGILVLLAAVYPIYTIVYNLLEVFRYHLEHLVSSIKPSLDYFERKVVSRKVSIAALGLILFLTAIFLNVVAQLFGTTTLKLMALAFIVLAVISLAYGALNILSLLVLK